MIENKTIKDKLNLVIIDYLAELVMISGREEFLFFLVASPLSIQKR
jgi:hypothetical protein